MCTSKPSPSDQACKCHQDIPITRIIPSTQEPLKEPLNQSHIFPFTNLFNFATLLPQVLLNQFTLQLSHHPFQRLTTNGSKNQDTQDSTYHFNPTHQGVDQRSRPPHCRIADPITSPTLNLNPVPRGPRRHKKRQETSQSDKQVKCFSHFSGARGTQKQDFRPKLLWFRLVSSETARKNRFLNSSNHPPSPPRKAARAPKGRSGLWPPPPRARPRAGGRQDPWPPGPPSADHGRLASGTAGRPMSNPARPRTL